MNKTLAAVVAALTVATLAGCASAQAAEVPPVEPAPVRAVTQAETPKVVVPDTMNLAVVGDSITAWDPPFAGDPAQSWVYSATSNEMPLVGGWAFPGAQTSEMAAALVAPTAHVDYLVIMAGTNDMYYQVPLETRFANYDYFVATTNPDEVIISAVAPYDPIPSLAVDWNAALATYAADRGYVFIDPWYATGIRAGDLYAPGTHYGDGVHPSPAAAALVGQSIRDSIIFLDGQDD